MDGGPSRRNKATFPNSSGVVRTWPGYCADILRGKIRLRLVLPQNFSFSQALTGQINNVLYFSINGFIISSGTLDVVFGEIDR